MIEKVRNKISAFFQKPKNTVFSNENIIIVYTMGKVGSLTVYKALKRAKPDADIFHVHFLSDNWLKVILPNEHGDFQINIKKGNDILSHIKNHPNKRVKIITLVREPIIRTISDLFENWKHIYDDIEKVDIKELKNRIEHGYHGFPIKWFKTEFYEYLGFEIYDLPFDKGKGIEIYNLKDVDILCMKLERLNDIGVDTIRKFTGVEGQLKQTNKSDDKKGSDQYDYLKKNIKMSKEKLEEIYSTKYVNHFYTENEISKFVKKWS